MKTPLCALLGAFATVLAAPAQVLPAPNISNTYPPTEDIRTPDLTIPGIGGGNIAVIAYNPNGRFLAVASADNLIRVYDARPGDRLTAALTQTLTGHTGQVRG